MATIPPSFVDLATAYHSPDKSFVNVIGIVVDILPPVVTKTGDHMATYKLLDPSFRDGVFDSSGRSVNGLKVRFFRRNPEQLPHVKQQGDIMLIRQIKMSGFQGQPLGISNYQTVAVVFAITSLPDSNTLMLYNPIPGLGHPQDVFMVEDTEKFYVVQLKRDMRSTYEDLPPPSVASPVRKYKYPEPKKMPLAPPSAAKPKQPYSLFGQKFRLIKDVRHRDFSDLCAQVVKSFPGQYGMELYVTDYTENKEVFFYAPPEMEAKEQRDGDNYGYTTGVKKAWPGPYGFLILKINTRDPHSAFAKAHVKEGDFVYLKNVKMKIKEDRTKLEGDMWPDDKNSEKIQIEMGDRIKQSSQVEELLNRKERYWSARAAKEASMTAESDTKQPTKLTKSEKNKRNKQKKKATDAAAAVEENALLEEAKSEVQPAKATPFNKKDLNPNIRCGHPEIPISSVRTILDPDNKIHTHKMPNGKTQLLPFVNAKYRTRVRVIDFQPKQIESFAIPSDDPSLGSPIGADSSQAYEWCFSLRVEDAAVPKSFVDENEDTMWVTVHHAEAQYLFGNNVGDPADLRTDKALLAKVKQQMFLLWGNLEEEKEDEEVSNRPFECCLMEYGIEMDDDDPDKKKTPFGYRRFYAMFGTTIT